MKVAWRSVFCLATGHTPGVFKLFEMNEWRYPSSLRSCSVAAGHRRSLPAAGPAGIDGLSATLIEFFYNPDCRMVTNSRAETLNRATPPPSNLSITTLRALQRAGCLVAIVRALR